jgi:hypothetical protein
MLGILPENVRNRERQVVANEIVGRVSEEDTAENASAAAPVRRVDDGGLGGGHGRCRHQCRIMHQERRRTFRR